MIDETETRDPDEYHSLTCCGEPRNHCVYASGGGCGLCGISSDDGHFDRCLVEAPLFLPVVIFDLDSTLCHTAHRRHLSPAAGGGASTREWKDYSLACVGDQPIEPTLLLAKMLSRNHDIVLMSARNGSARFATQEWLERYEVPYEALVLRPDYDDRFHTWKTEMVLDILQRTEPFQKQGIVLAVDDMPDAAETYEPLGIPLLVVGNGWANGQPGELRQKKADHA